MLGNPPWERVKLQEQEFFATREPEIANAKNAAARKKVIAALEGGERHYLFEEFRARSGAQRPRATCSETAAGRGGVRAR